MRILIFSCTFIIATITVSASETDSTHTKWWNLHFQQTTIGQYHPDFTSPYSGLNSQVAAGEPIRISITSTIYAGLHLWKGGELYFNPELSGGRSVGQTLGIAGFPNGETYRIGNTEPVVNMARLFYRQTINLGQSAMQKVDDGANQIEGLAPESRLVITAGKFAVSDMFDLNSYSHDARAQFMNWALMSAGAWDYPADTKGYTWGAAAEIIKPSWSIKGAITMVPSYANGPVFDNNVAKANSISVEYDHNFNVGKHKGIVRVIGFYTNAHMGNYQLATNDTVYHKDITATRAYGRTKMGFVINAELATGEATGIFARLSYNDGKNETWAFTEIDRSIAAGFQLKGTGWKRPGDKLGAAVVVNGLSDDHKNYLSAGGYGFIIGDGRLNYGFESILEAYYSYKLTDFFMISPDYQFVLNPAYNKDRGPIHLFGLRAHIEF